MQVKHVHYSAIEAKEPEEKGTKDTTIRWLITKEDGARNFAMRMFEIKEGGYTPYHRHDWEHEVFVLEGKGILVVDGVENELNEGDVVFIPPNVPHQFKNPSKRNLRFLCLIPYKD